MLQLDLLLPERLPERDSAGAKRAGDLGIKRGADKARRIDPEFIERAGELITAYLREHGISSGELLTDSCKLAGIRSSDDRHMGVVFRGLLKRGVIRWVGDATRGKGHGVRGGSRYALVR